MIKTQIWRPDTCSCVIEQVFDYATDPATLVEQTIIKACPNHSTPVDVLAENQIKNRGVIKVAEALGAKPDLVKWNFDGDRKCVLNSSVTEEGQSTKSLNNSEKNNVRTELAKISEKLILS
jgi:hypothetical protein